ncbi:ArsR/SmtB family transcription factor [Nocardia amamiensis]|uniref:ArsR/SmtB family transcription factor n=1 Tax=Nocardia amamiensis TaxID=404578 RepID=UPI002B4B5FE1|nr:metalloregulator ArsR/SmtB family transcription factor [Nocardia amamiensis]
MVENSSERLDTIFHALSDPTRRAMLSLLAGGERSVGELAAPFSMSLAAASKHIKVLERAGMVRRFVHGRTHTCALDVAPLRDGAAWLHYYEQFWHERIDALEAALEADDLEKEEQ